MRTLALLLCLALAGSAAAADHEYIVPIIGTAWSFDSLHTASAAAFNATRRTATVRLTGVYPLFPLDPRCPLPSSWTIPPRQAVALHFQNAFRCDNLLAAFSIVSDEPLEVTNSMQTILFGAGIFDTQLVEAPEAWIATGQESMVEAVVESSFDWRANLLVINPNDSVLTLNVHINRPEYRLERDEVVEVAPRSMRLYPLRQIDDPNPPTFPIVISGVHVLTIVGNGRYWAGTSSLERNGGNVFRKAIPLEP